MHIKDLLLFIRESGCFVLCKGYSDYLFHYEETDSWSVYNDYFTTQDVLKITITSKGLVEIILK